jgi:hypothetical protein
MWKFVSGNKSNSALFPETNFHIQKYDGLQNIEKPSRALESTLGSSTDPNLGHNHLQIKKTKCMREIYFGITFSSEVVDP